MKFDYSRVFLCCLGLVLTYPLFSQTNTVNYTASDSFIANPERGWFVYGNACMPNYNNNSNRWVTEALLKTNFIQGYRLAKHVTLIPTNTSAIPQWYLDSLNNEAARFRKLGMKFIIRFTYTWNLNINENDASQLVTENHMNQLKPYFEANSDVIFGVEMGFIGYWGEMHHSTNGHIIPGTLGLSASGKSIINKILEVVPIERFVSVRYPVVLYGPASYGSFAYNVPVTESTAYNGSNQSRLGAWYANFGAGEMHYSEDKDLMANWAAQTNYLPMWAHCDHFEDVDMDSQKWLTDARTFHYCALSNPKDISPTVDIYNKWVADGVYDDFANKVGYRLRLVSATFPDSAFAGETVSLDFIIANDGFARPTNPRIIEFVFRNTETSAEYKVQYKPSVDERLWLPGGESEKTHLVQFNLPDTIPDGTYQVLLNMPDPKPALYARPDYSIRLANTGLWEAATAYNDLKHVISISHHPSKIAVTGVDITNAPVIEIGKGDTISLNYDIMPSNASNRIVRFSSSDPSIVKVDPDDGRAMSVKFGNAKIIVETMDGNFTDTCTIIVKQRHVSEIHILNCPVEMTVGDTLTLFAQVLPANADEKRFQFKSSNFAVATLVYTGYLTARGEGTCTATVTAQDGNVSDTCIISVKNKTSSDIPAEIKNGPEVFPNPAGNDLNITGLRAGETNISIFNSQSKLIENVKALGESVQINFSQYPAGLYFIRIEYEGNCMFRKIIKM